MEKIKIHDESGDKNYFTVIPNFIANHSTANDQALYFQMKKHAGDKGQCFTSESYLRGKLGIGKSALKKSLSYLLDHGWIKDAGQMPVKTKGGEQLIKVYSIVDIWKLNNDFYEGRSRMEGVSRIDHLKRKRGVQNDTEGGSRMEANKNHINNINTSESSSQSSKKEDNTFITGVFELFGKVPAGWYSNKTQRAAALNLYKVRGLAQVEKALEFYEEHKLEKFCPSITSPWDLDTKWSKLKLFKEKA